MPGPHRRSLRESDLFLAASRCRSRDLSRLERREISPANAQEFLPFADPLTVILPTPSSSFPILSFFFEIRFQEIHIPLGEPMIPPTSDDVPGRSSILLYIPYVTFTMGSKEARNGRPVPASWSRSSLLPKRSTSIPLSIFYMLLRESNL